MDFNSEEQEILKLMQQHPLKTVPDHLMKDYVQEVMRKTKAPDVFPYIPALAFSLVLAAALMGAAAYIVLKQTPLHKPAAAVLQPETIIEENKPPVISSQEVKFVAAPQTASDVPGPAIEPARLEKLNQEIFILEMLGEDSGIDNPSRIGADLDLLNAAA